MKEKSIIQELIKIQSKPNNYFELISNRHRKNSLIVMFDYCSEGLWGKNSWYRFSRLSKPSQKEFLKWINDTTVTYFYYKNNKHRCELIDKKGFELAKKLKKHLKYYKIIYQSESGIKYLILEKQIIKISKPY